MFPNPAYILLAILIPLLLRILRAILRPFLLHILCAIFNKFGTMTAATVSLDAHPHRAVLPGLLARSPR